MSFSCTVVLCEKGEGGVLEASLDWGSEMMILQNGEAPKEGHAGPKLESMSRREWGGPYEGKCYGKQGIRQGDEHRRTGGEDDGDQESSSV